MSAEPLDELAVAVAHAGSGLRVVLCSYPRPPATVVEITGDIGARDAKRVSDYLLGFLCLDRRLVVDLSRVEIFSGAGLTALLRFAAKCRVTNQDWALVTSSVVDVALRITSARQLPIVASLHGALTQLAAVPNNTRDGPRGSNGTCQPNAPRQLGVHR